MGIKSQGSGAEVPSTLGTIHFIITAQISILDTEKGDIVR